MGWSTCFDIVSTERCTAPWILLPMTPPNKHAPKYEPEYSCGALFSVHVRGKSHCDEISYLDVGFWLWNAGHLDLTHTCSAWTFDGTEGDNSR